MTIETLNSKTDWFHEREQSLAEWSTMMEASAIILKYVRNHGYHHAAAVRELTPVLSNFTEDYSRATINEVLDFIETQSSRAGDQRQPTSSEVLGSLIGIGKQLQGREKNSYTKSPS